jgi:hypothetical protein
MATNYLSTSTHIVVLAIFVVHWWGKKVEESDYLCVTGV